MSNIKVFQGTRSNGAPRLCDTCLYGVVARGAQESQEIVYCSTIERPVAMRVVECNRYYDRTQTPLHEFKEIAWVLQFDSKRQKMGFLSADEFKLRQDKANAAVALAK